MMIREEELRALEKMGGELVEVREGELVVVKFEDTDDMLRLISDLKSHPVFNKHLTVNSTRKDGANFVRFERKRRNASAAARKLLNSV